MRKCKEWIPLHFLILFPFPHSLSIYSSFIILSPFSHFLSIFSQPGCQAATNCATLNVTMMTSLAMMTISTMITIIRIAVSITLNWKLEFIWPDARIALIDNHESVTKVGKELLLQPKMAIQGQTLPDRLCQKCWHSVCQCLATRELNERRSLWPRTSSLDLLFGFAGQHGWRQQS